MAHIETEVAVVVATLIAAHIIVIAAIFIWGAP